MGGVSSSKQSSTQQATSQQALDPQIKQALLDNYSRAQGIANTPFQPYTGQFVAGFNPQQQQAQNLFTNLATAPNPAMQQGIQAAGQVANYSPQQVTPQGYTGTGYQGSQITAAPQASAQGYTAANAGSQGYAPTQIGGTNLAGVQGAVARIANAAQANRGDVQNLNGGSLSADQINNYMNPYISDVVNTNASDIERARQIQNLQNNAQATVAGAFGGTGWGNLVGQTNDSALRAAATNSAQLRSQGFETATALGQQDLNRGLQAGQSNQAADLTTMLANLGNQQQTGLANQGALNNNSQFNANMFANLGLANAGAMNQTNQINAAAGNAASQFGAGAANTAALQNAQAQNTAGAFGAAAQNQNSQFNAQSILQQLLANQGSANQAGQFTAGATNAANSQNANNILSALQGNQSAGLAGAQLNLGAANSLGALGTQNFQNQLTGATALNASGTQQQQTQQQLLDALYSQYQQKQNWPLQLQQLLNSSLGLAGNPVLGSSQSTGSSKGSSFGFNIFGSPGGGPSPSQVAAAGG